MIDIIYFQGALSLMMNDMAQRVYQTTSTTCTVTLLRHSWISAASASNTSATPLCVQLSME